MQGTRVGQYELTRVLGRGAFGEVWLATDHRLGREVAIKRLKQEVVGDADVRRRFDREAKTLLQLNEPYVVRVFDRIEIEGTPALVTEYMEGGSLADLQETREEPFPVEDVQRWCEQAALGLAAVHNRGILHRDIKLANLFLSHDGNLSIGDFGLARDVDMTQTLGLQGTIPYMSPEQLRGEEVDARTDLFSLGVAIYELLTGKRPYGDGLDRAKRSGSADTKRSGIPAEFSDTIEALLELDRDKRVQSADELLARLRGEGPGRYFRIPSPRRLIAASVVLVAVVAAVFFGRALLSEPPPHECDLEPPTGRRVAVFPFTYNGSPEFERLGTEIPNLLASRLDGVVGVVVAPPESYANCSISAEVLTSQTKEPVEWMEEHHARLAVTGVITEISGRLRIDLSFRYHDKGVSAWYDDSSITLDDAAEVLPAVNDVGLEILSRLLRDPGDDLAREVLAAGTTLEALSAFIDSHWSFTHFQFGDAVFNRPASLDSTMALAYYIESMVADMQHQGDDIVREHLAMARRHADRLRPYGRFLLESAEHELNRDMDKAEATLVKAISAFPDRPWAILRLANLHYQHNSSRGRSMTESLREFEIVEELDPRSLIPVVFMQWLWALVGDDERMEYLAEGRTPPAGETMMAFTSGTQAARDSLLANENYCGGTLRGYSLLILNYLDNNRNVAQLIEAQLCDESPPADRVWTTLTLAHLNAGMGRWEAATRWFAEVPAPFRPFRLEYEALALSLPFIPLDEAQIRNMIRDLEVWQPLREPSRVDPQQASPFRLRFDANILIHEHLRLYCLAALHARLGDTAEARVVLERLGKQPVDDVYGYFIEDLMAMGEARIAFEAGDYAAALADLEKVREFRYAIGNYSAFFQRSDARYIRALCLAELGRHREAIGWFDAADEGVEFLLIYTAFGHLGQARALEQLGQPEDAAKHYQSFLDMMDECDPYYEDEVADVRERLQAAS